MSPGLTLAFTAGMVAAVNPCGFAMLPAYISYFLGTDDTEGDLAGNLGRALAVSAALTAGFVGVFTLVGVVLDPFTSAILERVPWFTLAIGAALVALGVAMLCGLEPLLRLPKLDRGGGSRQVGSMFVFGVSYAVASLSCTLPVFLPTVALAADKETFAGGLAMYAAYGLGMGLVIAFITVALALAKKGIVQRVRGVLPYVNRISGALLVLAGLVVAYFGWYEMQVQGGDLDPAGPATTLYDMSDSISRWVDEVGAVRLGLMIGALVLAASILAVGLRYDRSRRAAPRESEMSAAGPTVEEPPGIPPADDQGDSRSTTQGEPTSSRR